MNLIVTKKAALILLELAAGEKNKTERRIMKALSGVAGGVGGEIELPNADLYWLVNKTQGKLTVETDFTALSSNTWTIS